ncbi:hypothetical protein FQN54_002914 [Arachnomyces sp. PD_36]|nr:hypothetical protein FQN54_002914 [Arachnomyces sp. PD_36]
MEVESPQTNYQHSRPAMAAVATMAVGAFTFERRSSLYQKRRYSEQSVKETWLGPPLDTVYAGISVAFSGSSSAEIAVTVRDSTYLLEFLRHEFNSESPEALEQSMVECIISGLRKYETKYMEKFLGIVFPEELTNRCPRLCPKVWRELDIVPFVMHDSGDRSWADLRQDTMDEYNLDERSEAVARTCIRFFAPNRNPLLEVGFKGNVEVDAAFHARLATAEDYQHTVAPWTWDGVTKYADDLKSRNVKIAFFSSTPQGGGVALMRHSLVRFAQAIGVDIKWFVPKPRRGVFRITKTCHNILQGVSKPDERLTPEQKQILLDWLCENAQRYWLRKGGPLMPPSEGGADVIVIDDPQMPGLIPLIRKVTPDRPIIYRSHIQIRSDLVATPGSPQEDTWNYFWESIQSASLFLSHPVKSFVPHTVPPEKVGYLPASTDWLDGLNKPLTDWDMGYYGAIFNAKCKEVGMPTIDYPSENYFVQIARFDPSKGIFDVLKSYALFHKHLSETHPDAKPPKLLICGHGSVDDPDGSIIYDAVIEFIESALTSMTQFICVMRLGPSDQLLNALLSNAKVALQLSTREGFEIKVSEALHKGKPVIATRAGGIPLQVQDGKNGFLVTPGDHKAVARHLHELWTDHDLYHRMSEYAATSVSDEVSTAGQVFSWMYLASKLSKGEDCLPRGRWINDMAREDAKIPYSDEENKLKRNLVVET